MESTGFEVKSLHRIIRDMPAPARIAVKHLLCLAAGFLLARGNIRGQMYPFAVAFAAAVPQNYTFTAALGGGLGYLASLSTGVMSIRYIAAMIGAAAIVSLAARFLNLRENTAVIPLITFLSCLSTGITVLFAQGFSTDGFLIFTCDALLAGGMAYFFTRTFKIRISGKHEFKLDRQGLACLIIFSCVLLMSLGTLDFAGISPARIFAALIILFFAFLFKEIGGSITGICTGVALSLSTGMNHVAGVYALAGLMAGVFSPLGQLGIGAAFAVVNGVAAIILGSREAVATLFESAVATVIFVALPYSFLERMRNYFLPSPSGRAIPDAPRNALVLRLDTAANAIGQISSCVEAVSEGLKRMAAPELDTVFARVKESVCSGCGMRTLCWENNFQESSSAFQKIGDILREDGHFSASFLPEPLSTRCIRQAELAASFNKSYLSHIALTGAQGRVTQIREVVSDQFKSMADILLDLACDFSGDTFFEPEIAQNAAGVLKDFGLTVNSINCVVDKLGRMNITVQARIAEENFNRAQLTQALSIACNRELDLPAVTVEDETAFLVFSQKSSMKVRLGAVQCACEGAFMCGDYFECFNDGRGREVIVLSDGMGTGGRAAIDAAMAAELFSKLVKAGLGFDCALRVANSALLVKSADESLATLDVACVDLYTGKTDFMKAGGAASFVRHKNKAAALEQASLPAGILRDIKFAKASASLSPGDILLMASDGIIGEDNGWITEELKNWTQGAAQELAEHIAGLAKKRRGEKREDDMTIICAMIE